MDEGIGLGTVPRKLLEKLRELRSLDVLLPTRELKELLQRMKVLIPNRPKRIENVVEKMARFSPGLFDFTSLFLYNCGKLANAQRRVA